MRAAVYSDAVYRRDATGGLFTDETFIAFAAGLRDSFDELTLVGRLDDGPPGGRHLAIRRDVGFVPLPTYRSLADPGATLRATAGSIRGFWAVTRDVDVVWLLGPHPLALLFALVAALTGTAVVLGVRQDMPAHMRARHPRRRTLQRAATALELLWRGLARRHTTIVVGAALARRYAHAPSTVDITVSLFDVPAAADAGSMRRDYSDRVLLLLSVGRLDPEKNPMLLADVMVELHRIDARWRLIVCGDGAMRQELEARVTELGLGDHVDLLGWVTITELEQWYGACHALIHISWTEGVPQVLTEALALGLPTVATAVGGVAAATDGAVLLVPPGDASAVANAVHRISTDAVTRERLMRRGVDLAREHGASAERSKVATALASACAP